MIKTKGLMDYKIGGIFLLSLSTRWDSRSFLTFIMTSALNYIVIRINFLFVSVDQSPNITAVAHLIGELQWIRWRIRYELSTGVRKKVLVKVFQERNLVHHRLEFRHNEDMSLCLVAGPILENDLQLFQYQHKSLYDICHSCTWAWLLSFSKMIILMLYFTF